MRFWQNDTGVEKTPVLFYLYCSDKRCIIKLLYYICDVCEVSVMEYLTTVEMSKRWNISSRRIGVLCTEGRVEGAIKKGKMWLIPSDAVKPVDGRFKVNKVEA